MAAGSIRGSHFQVSKGQCILIYLNNGTITIGVNLMRGSVQRSLQFGILKKANRNSKIEFGQTKTRRLLWPRIMIVPS